MTQLNMILNSTWHFCLLISFLLFVVYTYNRKSKIEYMDIVAIILETEGIVFFVALLWQVLSDETCHTELVEKTSILLGAIAAINYLMKSLGNLIVSSKPNEA